MKADPAPVVETPAWEYTITPAFVSNYVFRGQLLDGFSAQPSFEADYKDFSFGLFSNIPFANKYVQTGVEIDPYGSYSFNVTDSLTIEPGFTLYTYEYNQPGLAKVTFEPSLAVNYTFAGITIGPKIYYDVVLQGPTYELNSSYSIKLDSIKSELDFAGAAGTYILNKSTTDSPAIRAWGSYWSLGASMPFTVAKGKLTVGFAYARGFDSYTKQGADAKVLNASAVGRGVVSVSYAYSF